MSVGRPAGSGTEAARGSGAQRARAERATAERTTADRATAEGTTAERTTAQRTRAGRTRAGRTAAGRTASEGTAAVRTATEGTAEEDNAAGRAPATQAGARPEPGPASNVVIVGSHTGPGAAPVASAAPVADTRPAADLFTRYTRDYVAGRGGQQVIILEAGCTTAGDDLGVGELREAGADIVVSRIDDEQPVTSAALSLGNGLRDCVQGDFRTVPLPPRSQDIVLCALLLQRIQHAELVLDRLVAATRPGGLLLLHFGDRDSAAGFLDRVLPSAARRAIWRRRRPGQPGPYPVVYERLSSARGVQAYALMRELVIAERRALGGLAGTLTGPPGFLAAQKLIAWLSRGRLTAAHEELLYVLRKPEDRFARIL